MSSIADRIKTAQDKDGMLRRALERIIQLYTDRSHFVYELLQNAEDAGATAVKFVQYPDRLEVMHDGKPFTAENLQGLCDIGKSDKVDNLNQIGEFGVGFKSVFGICDTVRLYSEPKNYRSKEIDDAVPFAVEIQDFTSPVDIPQDQMVSSYTTRFVFAYTVGRSFSGFKTIDELNQALSSKLQNLGITTLLFMKNLELIEYQICVNGAPIEGQYLLEKRTINDHCLLVSALGLSEAIGTQKEKAEEISYLKFSKAIDTTSTRTVDIAFPVVVTENGEYECQQQTNPYISVYFPTETESKLGFIVQGPYRTTPNRSSIPADEEDNKILARKTAILLRETLLELKEAGKLNMSFVKALPLSERSFDNYALFAPLYNTVKSLFARESIIPCKSGKYVSAKCAKIARQERLATLFTDELLTSLINDGEQYHWLPTYLTETNKEYEAVYKYLTSELRINLIRPEDLRLHFSANPVFLPQRSEDWIVELYSILENVGAAFSKAKNENNMLVANIIKTSKGQFVAAYRKTENKQYIPNVFLPSGKIKSEDIHFVDSRIYDRCRHFFDNILQLQKPNEYEFFVKDIKKRYSENYSFDAERHIDDLSHLYKYLKYEEYRDEIRGIINDCFLLKCNDGQMRNAYSSRLFLPVSQSGIQIEGYLKNIAKNVFFVDAEFYLNHGIAIEALCAVGVQDSLLYNDKTTSGQYYTGSGGRQPDWWTSGDFRWKMTMEYVKDAVKYISAHPSAKDSIIKSKAILSCLMENESKLSGTVYIGGSTPNKEKEPCELVKVLRGETMRDWNGKWLYTESMELVSHKHISKHDISTSIYGKVKIDSRIYELLGFRKTEADEVDDLKKSIPQNQLDAFFENELRQRFGITSADLTERYGSVIDSTGDGENDEYQYPFPTAKVKNWDTLKKHAAEMLIFADPVKYDYAVRRIRVSNRPKEARAYLMNMYRYDGLYRYACQLCHDSCSNIEVAQIFNNPEVELDPMNLCLCPNCAAMYRQMRSNTVEMDQLKKQILASREADLSNDDYVSFEVDGEEIWFTQIHIAEIQALLQLEQDVKVSKAPAQIDPDEDDSKDGLSVFDSYLGKQVKRKDGFLGEITKVSDGYLYIKILKGPKAGEETKVQVSWLSSHPGVYEVIQ